jgi:hypothetical protein
MKKLILTLTVLVFLGVSAMAQISLRPQAGILFNSLSYESVQGELTSKAGISIGADLQIGGSFYFQPGLNINPTKFQIENVGDIKVTALNVPVMVGYKLFEQESRAFGIRIFAGPNFGFHLNNTIADAITDIEAEDLKNFDLSAIGGVGLDISILFVDLGYKYGITETISPKIGDGANLNSFMLNAGVRIGF